MKKQYSIFYCVKLEGQWRKYTYNLWFYSSQEAENYIIENPDKFQDDRYYTILPIFVKE